MNSNRYSYAGYTEQPPAYQPYHTAQYPEQRSSQGFLNQNYSGHRYSYAGPQYGTIPPAPHVAELPVPTTFVAELPAALPTAPPTTTSPQQLNQDELLAHKLQNLEIAEARRRSSSNVSLQTSHYSLRDAASLTPQTSQNQLEPTPALPPRPRSGSFSSTPFFGPDSFGPPPATFETNDARMLMAQPNPLSLNSQIPSLPEVVVESHSEPPSVGAYAPLQTPSSPVVMDPDSLASYLELNREVPRPPQWALPPVVDTLYGSIIRSPKATDWLDTPLSQEWRRIRSSQNAVAPVKPTYSFAFKTGGGFIRDARFSWTMSPEQWVYNLKLDDMTGQRKSELLTPPNGIDLITTYLKAWNYDSLRFTGSDGRVYLWVAHAPLSSAQGARLDILRHALFMAPRGCDPLYGEIVADHTYWDGFIDHFEVHRVKCVGCGASPINGLRWKCKSCTSHDICDRCRVSNTSAEPTCVFTLANVPDEALYIRSPHVDPALVCATLQILKDWELNVLRTHRNRDPEGFRAREDIAREGALGKLTYWRVGDDFGKKSSMIQEPVKDVNLGKASKKGEKAEKVKSKERAKEEKKKKEKAQKEREKSKGKDKKGAGLGIGELIRGSAQVGGSVGDVGEALRRDSRSSAGT